MIVRKWEEGRGGQKESEYNYKRIRNLYSDGVVLSLDHGGEYTNLHT